MHAAAQIPSFPNYIVTRTGKIINRNGNQLKPADQNGYHRVFLYTKGGRRKRRRVHTIVCEVFHGPKPTEEHEVRHLDNNRANNHADNLRWGTKEENGQDKRQAKTVLGERNPNAKVTDDQARAASEAYAARQLTLDQIAEHLQISKTQAWRICTNRRKTA